MKKIKEILKKNKKFYLIFTMIFILCASFFIGFLLLNGKTNINKIDGASQYYRSSLYYSRFLRNVLGNLFSKGELAIPLWDHSLGEGADIITTLHGYGLGDPIAFLSILFPQKYMYVFYYFNSIIRIYLAGIFFSLFCLYKKNNNTYGVLAGTLAYCFSYWALHNFTMHTYFLSPLMYLPLIILALDIYIDTKSPSLFIFAVFISSISWLYFFYMEALATAIYGILMVFYKNKCNLKICIKELLQILLYALVGLMMAAVVLLPVVSAYLSDSRLSTTGNTILSYPLFFYERLFTIFLANDYPYDLYLGFVSATLLGISLVLKEYKKHLLLVIIYILCIISVCIPVVGKVWNGFAYVSQRYSFIIGFPVCYSLVLMWDKINSHNRAYLLICTLFIIALSIALPWSRSERVLVPVGICLLFCLISISKINMTKNNIDIRQLVMCLLIILNIFYNYNYHLSERGGDALDDMMSIEKAKTFIYDNEAYVMKKYYTDGEFFRYDTNLFTDNDAVNNNVYSTNYYWSITNPELQATRLKLGIRDRIVWQLNGYDSRGQLETLSNVKYFINNHNNFGVIPYGFSILEESKEYDIYKNDYYVPFGYSYTKSISYETWDKLNPLEKQEALMEYAVIEDGNNTPIDLSRIKTINYSVSTSDNVNITNNSITTNDYNQSITLVLDENLSQDRYLLISGLEFYDVFNEIEDDHTMTLLTIESNGVDPSFLHHMTLVNRYYFDKHDYIVYLDHSGEDNIIKITFSLPGEYVFENLNIYEIDMNNYESYINSLSKDSLQSIVFENNSISGKIESDDDNYILLSIPYSKGWMGFVDGNKTKLYKANGQYISLKVEKGKHEVSLKYSTPGLKAGLFISLLAFATFCYILKEDKKYDQ